MQAKVGDIVEYQGQRWVIVASDSLALTVTLRSWEGQKDEVPNDQDIFKLIARPQVNWVVLTAPVKPGHGPLTSLKRGGVALTPFVDWAPSALERPGGSIFVSPKLKLRTGEILLATYQNGKVARVPVTANSGSLAKKSRKKEEPKPLTVADRILRDD